MVTDCHWANQVLFISPNAAMTHTTILRPSWTLSGTSFYRLDALPAAKPTASKQWMLCYSKKIKLDQYRLQWQYDYYCYYYLLVPFYRSLDFVHDNQGEPVLEETFTHSHLSWSSVIPYLLPPSILIHDIHPVQFLHNFCPKFSSVYLLPVGLAPSILHTFLHPIIVFFSHQMPIPSQSVSL